ncbi:MAG: DUF2127 domain-containing protein [Actinomycetota bacterium]|nr:DUF2127 domain-containing protein [Actinomycetota bacterium]
MGYSRPRDWWDRFFAAGVVLKGLDGVAELTGGLLLLLLDPARIHRFVLRLAQPELSADPKDFIAVHLLQAAGTLTGSTVFYAALYLLAHGAVKVVLVAALLMNRLWAYPWMIGVLLAFIAYQLYQFAVAPTAGLAALTIFDALVVFLTWHEYGRQRRYQGT